MEIMSCCLLVFVYFCVVWHKLLLLWQKLSCLWQKLPGIYYISRMPGNVSVHNDNIGVWPGKPFYMWLSLFVRPAVCVAPFLLIKFFHSETKDRFPDEWHSKLWNFNTKNIKKNSKTSITCFTDFLVDFRWCLRFIQVYKSGLIPCNWSHKIWWKRGIWTINLSYFHFVQESLKCCYFISNK